MSAATDDPTGISIPKDSTYMTHRQVQEFRDDIKDMEKSLGDPGAQFGDRGTAVKQLKQLKHDLEVGEPPDTTPAQRDALAREAARLTEIVKEGMCSFEEMRKRPPGAVGKHRKHNKTMPEQIRLKNILRILHKGDDDPDVSNLEKLRPRTSTLNMDNAFIPGKDYFPSPNTSAYREGYDRTFGPKDQAPADPGEIAALKQQLARLEKLVSAKAAAEPQQAKPESEKPFAASAACGREFRAGAQHRADFAVRGHQKGCDECKAVLAQGDAT
jgi:hypothetical protein